ncbi:MAG: glycoside hydrolase family 127 protein [Paludibacter sp.]|nr:glycoside hydrolase family 127 protein [Paludibacter sp.]
MKKYVLLFLLALLSTFNSMAQDKLYPTTFPLGDVTLLDGPFKHARDLNVTILLQYDVDRLLAPYRKEAGLPARAVSYPNWMGLDGHIGGHYLSALAINYAAVGDTACKRRMDYMISELKACQDANALLYPSWGVGYAGGVPGSSSIWSTFKYGIFTNFNAAWVPWYNVHKTYAGLRDAWLYGGSETAKTMFLAFCDWGINITSALSNTQIETMLTIEHGGMNEIFADAYQMTGNVKYLTAARRFSHKVLLNSLAVSTDNLDNIHANTQIPKAVGFQRIAKVSGDATYKNAGQFFWETVTGKRSLSLGGNSRQEYFPQASACNDYVNVAEGPETCNTYNMLKLTEDLFRMKPQAKYADYYERSLYNHILSSQHPGHGGFVYFTSARPRHYRVYSTPNEGMWCDVGTGMENHGKYGEFIYSHVHDSLFVNLFVPSVLNWKEKGVTIRQETIFPDEERTRLTISTVAPTQFKLIIRHPAWVPAGAFKIIVGNDTLPDQSIPSSYVTIDRTWNGGEIVSVLLPMHTTIEQLPNVTQYISIMHGPILLGAKTGTEDLLGLKADDSRWGHIANGTLLPLDQAPIMVGEKATFPSQLVPVAGKPLTFTAQGLFVTKSDSALVLEPFFRIHDSRYMMYWLALNKTQYQTVVDSLANVQKAALELEARTIDKVAPGEQQPEVDHKLLSASSNTGNYQNEFWRDASSGGFVSYSMLTKKESDLSLMVRYWGNESGSRKFDILIDGAKLTTENIVGKWNKSTFMNVEYAIPNSMTAGKDTVTVRFQPVLGNVAGGLFYVRVLRSVSATDIPSTENDKSGFKVTGKKKSIQITGITENALVYVYDTSGRTFKIIKSTASNLTIPVKQSGVMMLKIVSGNEVVVRKIVVN